MAYTDNNHQTGRDARKVGADVAETAADLAEKAGHHIEKAVGKAESTLRGIADQSGEAGERVQEVAGNLKTAIDKSVKDQPMATLVVAALLGFALGALWKS